MKIKEIKNKMNLKYLKDNKLFDVVVCCAPKDYIKLYYNIKSIIDNVVGFENIYIISPTNIDDCYKNNLKHFNVNYYNDKSVLNIDISRFRYRPSWIYQQFLKLFQNITKNDWYLTVDSDVIFNKKTEFFNQKGNPIWYSGWDQNHSPYFEYQDKMFGFGKIYKDTFICDMNFFNKNIILDMLETFNYTINSFYEKSVEIINSSCYIAEPEIYGNYFYKYFPNLYEIKKMKNGLYGKNHPDLYGSSYTEEEIKKIIESMKCSDFQVFTMHSWLDENSSY